MVAVAAVWISLSMWRPQTFARFRFLPQPADQVWNDGCNDHSRHFEPEGLFWVSEEFQTLVLCFEEGRSAR